MHWDIKVLDAQQPHQIDTDTDPSWFYRQDIGMPTQVRDEFSERTKRTVAERAAYICSNPTCRRPTIGPHSDSHKALKTGEACHIHGAAPGGPRYDPGQEQAQRRNITNAIWLCTECSTRIDLDKAAYQTKLLHTWKRNHEDWIANGGIVPSLPAMSLTTLDGLRLPEFPVTITARACEDARQHLFKISNVAEVEMLAIEARVQVPEPIILSHVHHKPAGVDVVWEAVRPDMTASVTGPACITRNRPPLPTIIYRLEIDRIPPSHYIEIDFLTSTKIHDQHDVSLDSGPFADLNKPPNLLYFIDGTFQFKYGATVLKKRFFAPIEAGKENRHFRISEVRGDLGDWMPQELTFFS